MSTSNDDSTHCDVCAGQFFPGCAYENGDTDTVVELWPRWNHDPGYHVCLDCLRREHEQRYLAEIKRMDALARQFRDDTGTAA